MLLILQIYMFSTTHTIGLQTWERPIHCHSFHLQIHIYVYIKMAIRRFPWYSPRQVSGTVN